LFFYHLSKAIDTQNVLVSNYSHLDSARFPYFELLVISLCKSFHIILIHIHIYKPMFSHYSYPLLCFYEISDMHSYAIHIFDMVFRVRICTSGYAGLGLLSFLCPLSFGLLFVALMPCRSDAKSFAPTMNCFWLFEHLMSELWVFWGWRYEHLRSEL
jgi:hypothetical protein